MRRQVKFDDYEVPLMEYKVSISGGESRSSKSTHTQQMQMKSIKIETIIRSADKQSIGVQVTPHFVHEKPEKNKKQIDQNEDEEENLNQQNNKIPELSQQVLKKVQRFLKRVTPLMENQILQNLPQYQSYGKQNDKEVKRDSRLVYTLQNLTQQTQNTLEISDIASNATGVTIAASYSRQSHEGTCSHKALICLWYIHKRDFKPTKPQIISTPNCIFCISFHPKKPSILACGSYVGEVLLYDISRKEEQLMAKTINDDYFHRDLVTQLTWWAYRPPGKSDVDHNLLTLGADGKILLWQTPNEALSEETLKDKNLLKYPIKGYLMLRKKQKKIIAVSGLSMNQSRINKNVLIVGSQGGSILAANLTPINHQHNSESKVILDIQQSVKFKQKVYPFLLNIPSKNLPQIKAHVEAYCLKNKIKEVDSLGVIFNSRPELKLLYPNPIVFAYQQLHYPISSISDNRYGLFLANGCDGYSKIYIEGNKKSIQAIEEGWYWGWIDGGSRLAGFIGQQWVVVDFLSEQIVWRIGVGEGGMWKWCGGHVGVVCQGQKIKLIELSEKIMREDQKHRVQINDKIEGLKIE